MPNDVNTSAFRGRALDGRLTKAIDGSTASYTLTTDEAQYAVIELTGAITANKSIYFPAVDGLLWFVINSTTGNYTVTTYVTGGNTGVAVAPGKAVMIMGDGTKMRCLHTDREAMTAGPLYLTLHTGPSTWTNMPAAVTELLGTSSTYRAKIDLAPYTRARVMAAIPTGGSLNAVLCAQYSADESSWLALDGVDGPGANIAAVGTRVGTVANITQAARDAGLVALRIVGMNGDGTADPVIGTVCVLFY